MRSLHEPSPQPDRTQAAWQAMLGAARIARRVPPPEPVSYRVDAEGSLHPLSPGAAEASLHWDPATGWTSCSAISAELRALATLYLPMASANADRPLSVAHLGQSLDGFVATASGDSHYVNGQDNLVHLHRMRALSDAVIVGAGTVSSDAPRLTTRLVAGGNPCRVVIDPYGRLEPDSGVFVDGAAPTLAVRATDAGDAGQSHFGAAEMLTVPAQDGRLDLASLLETLRARGLHVLFVEGGGITVSAFLAAGLLDRLQVAVAPLFIGGGRPGVRVPDSKRMSDCLRPVCRLHPMGNDVLFDCDLRASPL